MAKTNLIVVGAVVAVILGLLVVILPLSFVGLEYYQLGFKKSKSTGAVNTDRVYTGGKYAIGPDSEFKVFKADFHMESFTDVTVFASDRLEVSVSARFQYFLRPHQLELLHRSFDIQYEAILRNNALDALKGAGINFSTREYLRNRTRVEEELFKAVRTRLGGRCCEKGCKTTEECAQGCKPHEICRPTCLEYAKCRESDWGLFAEVRYFQLTQLGIPDDLNQRYLQALVLKEKTETEQFKQEAQIVRKETDGLVQKITNAATEISQNATAMSSLLTTKARANADAIVEDARTDGLKHLYAEVGLTSAQHKASFDYLRTLKGHDNVRLTVNYQQMIAGPLN